MYEVLYTWAVEKNGVITGESVDLSIKFEYEAGYPAITGGPSDMWEPGCPDIVYDYHFDVVAYRNAQNESWDASEMLDEDKLELMEEFLECFDTHEEFAASLEKICLEHVYSFQIPEWEPNALCGYPDDYTDGYDDLREY